jgi:ATP-dependent exoDNAse (exonuclease V) alpha subunit
VTIQPNLCEIAVKLLEIPATIFDDAIAAKLVESNLIAESIGPHEAIFIKICAPTGRAAKRLSESTGL